MDKRTVQQCDKGLGKGNLYASTEVGENSLQT